MDSLFILAVVLGVITLSWFCVPQIIEFCFFVYRLLSGVISFGVWLDVSFAFIFVVGIVILAALGYLAYTPILVVLAGIMWFVRKKKSTNQSPRL